MDYDSIFKSAIERLHGEGRYRVFVEILRTKGSYPNAMCFGGNGPKPVTDPAPFLEAYRAHRLEREAQILAQLAAGVGRIADMVPTLYAGVDERLWPAAALSVWAHLIALVRQGRVVAEPEATLQAVYRPV